MMSRAKLEAAYYVFDGHALATSICLSDLLLCPKTIKWISRLHGVDKIMWGLVRLGGPSGGYVIRRYASSCVSVSVLEQLNVDLRIGREGMMCTAKGKAECELLDEALRLRSEAHEK